MRKMPVLALLSMALIAGAILWVRPWAKVTKSLPVPQNLPAKVEASKGQPLGFTTVDLAKAPPAVQKLAQLNRDKETTAFVVVNMTPYIVATRGVKPTAGYGIEITGLSVVNLDKQPIIDVKIKYTDPPPGQVTAQVLTYPMVIARMDLFSVPQGLVIQVERS